MEHFKSLPWVMSVMCFLLGLWIFWREVGGRTRLFGFRRERAGLKQVSSLLHEIEETLESGLVPKPERWAALDGLPPPWGRLASESLRDLRSKGGALIPTLRRLRQLADAHLAALSDARARSSQAQAQALVCALMVPLFGAALYALLPGVGERPWLWALFCGLALAFSACGALWILGLSDRARWAGLRSEERPWILAAQCAGEKFLALVRSGVPSDLAWGQAAELLGQQAGELARLWGYSVFESAEGLPVENPGPGDTRKVLITAGRSMKKAVHVSIMEGRPCTERVESVLQALRNELRACLDRELTLLGARTLQPLFVFVAPSLLGLLAAGLVLSWKALC